MLIAATGPILATSGKLFRDTPTDASYGRNSAYSYALFQPAPKEASVGGFLFVLRTGPKKATSDGILHDTPTEASYGRNSVESH